MRAIISRIACSKDNNLQNIYKTSLLNTSLNVKRNYFHTRIISKGKNSFDVRHTKPQSFFVQVYCEYVRAVGNFL